MLLLTATGYTLHPVPECKLDISPSPMVTKRWPTKIFHHFNLASSITIPVVTVLAALPCTHVSLFVSTPKLPQNIPRTLPGRRMQFLKRLVPVHFCSTSTLLAMQSAVIATGDVSLSVMFRYFVQRNEGTIVRSLVSDGTTTLVSGKVRFIRIFSGDYPQWVSKSEVPPCHQQKFETVQDRMYVSINH